MFVYYRMVKKEKLYLRKMFFMGIKGYYAFLFIIVLGLFSSCVSRQKIVYFQNLESEGQNSKMAQPKLTFKPDDLINITVSAASLDAARPFNVVAEARPPMDGIPVNTSNLQQMGYLVDKDGNIQFPQLGTIHVEGLTIKELQKLLIEKLEEYLQDPIVNIRINYSISVLGEVARPGTYMVNGEKNSIAQAIGLAGDMTIYGKRENVLVVRETGETKTYQYLDFTKSDIMDSEYYYLQQNDVVYVEPNSAQRQAASFNRNSTVYISIASLLLSVIVLITK